MHFSIHNHSFYRKYFQFYSIHKKVSYSKQEINQSLLDLYNIPEPFIHFDFHVCDKFFRQFEDEECWFHMLPCYVEMLWANWHSLMKFFHYWAFVVVGSSEDVGQEKDHCWVKLWDVANILEKEGIDAIIGQNVLVKLCNHLLEFVMASQLLEKCSHFCLSIEYNFMIYTDVSWKIRYWKIGVDCIINWLNSCRIKVWFLDQFLIV